jgi:hypothetical protein
MLGPEIREQLRRLEHHVTSLEARATATEADAIERLTAEATARQLDVERAEEARRCVEHELEIARAEARMLRADLDTARAEVAQLRASRDAESATLRHAVLALQSEVTAASHVASGLRRENRRLTSALAVAVAGPHVPVVAPAQCSAPPPVTARTPLQRAPQEKANLTALRDAVTTLARAENVARAPATPATFRDLTDNSGAAGDRSVGVPSMACRPAAIRRASFTNRLSFK